jgi:hypothetical protein
MGVSALDPGGDLVGDRRLVGDTAVETLRGEDAEFADSARLSQEPCLGV